MWPGGLYGAPASAPLTLCEVEGWWCVTLDAPWTPEGLDIGGFPSLERAVAFCYGHPIAGCD